MPFKAKAYLECKYPEFAVKIKYSLAGRRGRAVFQTRYASLAEYERKNAEADNDNDYLKLIGPLMDTTSEPSVDQFYRVFQEQ